MKKEASLELICFTHWFPQKFSALKTSGRFLISLSAAIL
jgi:hypothetical protein